MNIRKELLDLLCFENDKEEQRFIEALEMAVRNMKWMQLDHGLTATDMANSGRGYLYYTSMIGHEIVEAVMEEMRDEN